jgi:predicted phage terminase large subunit-like protein
MLCHGSWMPGARQGRASLLDWGREFLPEHFHRPPSGLQSWLAAELDGWETFRKTSRRGVKLNIVGPRGAAKSTLGSLAFPLRAAVEAREAYIWITSDTRHQAVMHLENIKSELLDNRRLRETYSDAAGQGPRWRHGGIQLRNGVAIEAYGTGQRIRGYRRRAERPTLVICDDLQNDQHMSSAAMRDASRRWFHGTLLKSGTKRTHVLHLATALHREALAIELTRTPGWQSRVFQAIERWPDDMLLWEEWEAIYADCDQPNSRQRARAFYHERQAEMDTGARLLWPEEEDLYTLMCMRAEGGRAAFEREKQSSPVQPELCEWPESYFDGSIWFDSWPDALSVKVLSLDPSKGRDDRRGDYSAYVMLGIDAGGALLVEADLARRATPQMVADGVGLYARFRPDAFGVEVNQFQELLANDFAAEFRRQGMLAGAVWTIDNRVNKLVRIRRLGPYLAARRLKFKADSPATRLLVNQLRDFPAADHDDGPDALEMAIRLADQMTGDRGPPDNLGSRFKLSV